MVTATVLEGNNYLAKFAFEGKSTDTKPTGTWKGTNIKNGSHFFELDTQKVTFYDGDAKDWFPKP